jgi:hypothetical protein
MKLHLHKDIRATSQTYRYAYCTYKTCLICSLSEAHEEIVWFNVSMQGLYVNILDSIDLGKY